LFAGVPSIVAALYDASLPDLNDVPSLVPFVARFVHHPLCNGIGDAMIPSAIVD